MVNGIKMLSLSDSRESQKDVKDADAKTKTSKRRDKEIAVQQPTQTFGGLTAGTKPTWKPPTHAQRLKEAAHGGMVEATRKWVSGELSTEAHKKAMSRGHKMVKAIPRIRNGTY
jgi:hypothetical protein